MHLVGLEKEHMKLGRRGDGVLGEVERGREWRAVDLIETYPTHV